MAGARRWWVAGALSVIACNSHEAPPAGDPCVAPGAICHWMGKPGVAMLSADGLDRRKEGLYLVQDVAFSSEGEAFVADFNNHRIVKVGTDDVADTISGTGVPGDGPSGGGSCLIGCEADTTELWHPSQVVADPSDPNVLYAAAWHNHRLVRIDLAKDRISWLAGQGEAGFDDAPTLLSFPSSVVLGDAGELYFSDMGNQVVRRLNADGTVEVVAGTPGVAGYSGDGGPAVEATLHGHSDWFGGPTSKLARSGSRLVLADTLNGVIREIDLDAGTVERIAGQYIEGDWGSTPGYEGDGGPAVDAVFAYPRAVAFGPGGELYVADSSNHCVRVIGTDGIVQPFAGRCGDEGAYDGDGGPALEAGLNLPCGVTVDDEGHVYISDSNNHVVRRVTGPAD